MLPAKACVSIAPDKGTTQDALPPNVVSMFWHCFDDASFDPSICDNNKTDYSLFTFDIIKSLNTRERDFLIHARLGHLPRPKILQMIKNATTGIANLVSRQSNSQKIMEKNTRDTHKDDRMSIYTRI
jgi:hypothetical protein